MHCWVTKTDEKRQKSLWTPPLQAASLTLGGHMIPSRRYLSKQGLKGTKCRCELPGQHSLASRKSALVETLQLTNSLSLYFSWVWRLLGAVASIAISWVCSPSSLSILSIYLLHGLVLKTKGNFPFSATPDPGKVIMNSQSLICIPEIPLKNHWSLLNPILLEWWGCLAQSRCPLSAMAYRICLSSIW